GQKDLVAVGKLILSELAPVVSAQQGMLYTIKSPETSIESTTATIGEDTYLKLLAGYAFSESETIDTLKMGQGLVGQCAVERQKLNLTNVPNDYVKIS